MGEAAFEQEIKRSRFIARIRHIENTAQARDWFTGIRMEFPDARHICWAYIAGPPDTTEQSLSDAGEPSGTAGKPMLNVLQHSGAGEIAAVVVRYFGGIKLGTGGLVRAYSSSVAEAMKLTRFSPKTFHEQLTLSCPFAEEHDARYWLQQCGGKLESVAYSNNVKLTCIVPQTELDKFLQKLPHAVELVKA